MNLENHDNLTPKSKNIINNMILLYFESSSYTKLHYTYDDLVI